MLRAQIKDGMIHREKNFTNAQWAVLETNNPTKAAKYWAVVGKDELKPVLDIVTHKDGGSQVRTLEVDHVLYAWPSHIPKTQQELDADKEAKLPDDDDIQFQISFDHENRIRALEGRPGPITMKQFRTDVKGM